VTKPACILARIELDRIEDAQAAPEKAVAIGPQLPPESDRI
jgi:hypothetical protein